MRHGSDESEPLVLTTRPRSWFPDKKEAWTQNRSDVDKNVIQIVFKPLFKVTFKVIERNLSSTVRGGETKPQN